MIRAVLFRINTTIVILAAAGLVLGAAGALLVQAEALAPDETAPFRWFDDALRELDGLSGSEAAISFALAIVAGALGTAIAVANVLLLTPWAAGGPRYVTIFLRDGQDVAVPRDVVERRIRALLAEELGVSDPRVRVRGQQDERVDVHLAVRVPVAREAELRTVLSDLRDRLAQATRDEFGLEVGDLRLAAQTEADGGAPVASPDEAPPPAATAAEQKAGVGDQERAEP